MLKMIIYCAVHDDADVIPAGDEFHWIESTNEEGRHRVHELDAADLYCTGVADAYSSDGTFEHQFIASVYADTTENYVYSDADGRGFDVIL